MLQETYNRAGVDVVRARYIGSPVEDYAGMVVCNNIDTHNAMQVN